MRGEAAGRALEHYLFTELNGFRKLTGARVDIHYWRTKTGQQVDFILGQADTAIECKISDHIQKRDLSGLIAFHQEYPEAKLILVCLEKKIRTLNMDGINITIYPIKDFFEKLWNGEVMKS